MRVTNKRCSTQSHFSCFIKYNSALCSNEDLGRAVDVYNLDVYIAGPAIRVNKRTVTDI